MKKLTLDEQKILNLYISGLSTIRIAKEFKCCAATINKILHKHGIKLRTNKEYRTKYSFHHDFFSIIDTEEKAYWLGFMFADGNVRKNKNQSVIQIKVNDFEIIEKFIKSINGNMSVKQYYNWTGKKISAIHLTSDRMYNDLIKHGCVPNKSLILKFPDESIFADKSLIRHFIRGYFDGDGSATYSLYKRYSIRKKETVCKIKGCIQFIGTKNIVFSISKYLNWNTTIYKEKRNNSNTWYLSFSASDNINRFYHLLYDNASIYLNRKKKKIEEIINYRRSETIIGNPNLLD